MSRFSVVSPVDGREYTTREYATRQQIDEAVTQAEKAKTGWRNTSLKERRHLCNALLEEFTGKTDLIAEQICWQMGRPIQYCEGEVNGVVQRSRYMIEAAEEALKDIEIENSAGFQRFIKRDPLGLVLVVSPWNYPYLTAINSVIPALLAGNVVILKPSKQTPLSAEQLVAAAHAAGFPDGVFQCLHLTHESTEALITHPAVRHIAFTGSVQAGRRVEQVAAGHFKSVGLELGGKDPAYVRHDANLEAAVATVIDGAFFNSGQSCCGIERIYVHKSVYKEFVQRAVALVEQYKLERPDDNTCSLGPLVNSAAADFVRQQIADALAAGAHAHIDEARFPLSKAGTAYLAPQLLTNVDHSMRVMTEESFGPVVGVQMVEHDEEAIQLMNDSAFGLSAAVFTQNEVAGIEIGEQLETGTFFVNRCDYLDPALVWTGVKDSGRGGTLSVLGFHYLTRPKSFHIKRGDV
ncbi:aldehyde dehydrogenase family protein [Ketobacter sp.]|nr:MAG: aldehyde dehydrogenase family protein [Ketobacter sp.]